MSTISKLSMFLFLIFSFTHAEAASLFFGMGSDLLNPRTERSESGATSFSTSSELSYQAYATLGLHMDKKRKHSLRGTYYRKYFELDAPTSRTFTELEYEFDTYNVMYNYSGQSFDFYLDYLNDQKFVYHNPTLITTFEPTLIEAAYAGAGFRFKAYSDKPHNLFSYMKKRGTRDDEDGNTSYSKGFRLVLDFSYYYLITSEEAFGFELDAKSKIKAGIKIEKGGLFNIGAQINFTSEEYEWENDTYTVLDFGAGAFLKINY